MLLCEDGMLGIGEQKDASLGTHDISTPSYSNIQGFT